MQDFFWCNWVDQFWYNIVLKVFVDCEFVDFVFYVYILKECYKECVFCIVLIIVIRQYFGCWNVVGVVVVEGDFVVDIVIDCVNFVGVGQIMLIFCSDEFCYGCCFKIQDWGCG